MNDNHFGILYWYIIMNQKLQPSWLKNWIFKRNTSFQIRIEIIVFIIRV